MNWEKYSQYSMVNLSLQRFINHELRIRGPKVFITDVLNLSPKKYKKKKTRLAYKIYSQFEHRVNATGVNTFNNGVRIALANWNTEFEDDGISIPMRDTDNVARWLGILSGLVSSISTDINKD